uniref:ribosomal protein L23 n=1 Tax=Vallisneria natans TaxID=62345 RepID=UPI0022FD4933|nr:ribosomal protein L23 [Vallisneria natans]WAO28700.1 ribosomal protein L23 [Vallisneria natans]
MSRNEYTSHVKSKSSRTEIKHWVELFFSVKIITMNNNRLPEKGRRTGSITYYKTYNAFQLQTNYHYASTGFTGFFYSTGLFYSTSYILLYSYKGKNEKPNIEEHGETFIQNFYPEHTQ